MRRSGAAPRRARRRARWQGALELRQDPGAVVAAHREDEREAEAPAVLGVERVQARVFLRRAAVEPRAGLLARGGLGQLARDRGLPGQFRMRADQRELFVRVRRREGFAQRGVQRVDAGERSAAKVRSGPTASARRSRRARR
jgi:hypothetical protein